MRIKLIQPFDRFREYQPGERALYRDTVIVAERWTKSREDLANTPGNLTPLFRCSRCAIHGMDCSKFCDEYSRTDKKRIFFKELYGLKTLLYKKQSSNETK